MQQIEITGVNRQSYQNNSCIIVSNGKLYLKDLKKLLKFNKPRRAVKIIACDGASDFLKSALVTPDVIIGDLDSAAKQTLQYYRKKGTIIKQVKDQNQNDLEKAIRYAVSKKYSVIHLLGVSGKRIDHSLNNFSVLLKFIKKAKLVIHDNGFEGHFISRQYSSLCTPGTIVSLIPMPAAYGITSKGLKYPLKNSTLALGVREGALNETTGDNFSVKMRKGLLLVLVK